MGNWYEFPRWRDEFEKGLDEYLEDAFATRAQGDQISCPCEECVYRVWFREKNIVKDHVISNGFVPRSEKQSQPCVNIEETPGFIDEVIGNDDIDGLLHDTFINDLPEETTKFYKLMEEGQQELYPGCKNFSKLSFTIRLFLFKCENKISNSAFNDLLKLLRAMQPDAKLPSSFNEAKSVLKGLGLSYIKIDACSNDCMLYWEDQAEATHCRVCQCPRWKPDERIEINGKPRQIPFKILRYFPIKKRLQRLFMCTRTAIDMTWHVNGRPKDNLLRHRADGKSWKDFDLAFPKFVEEPRNVRLGLATDGFNPFNTMSISHSTWPVILMNYNLPPWMCMKPEFFMLALLIPGPQSPGNDIDVYLQPLIKELNELWEFGLETYDASSKQMFKMHAALMFTVSDFPAYSMLSGWSTKGKRACPDCHHETSSEYLRNSKKNCYMDHQRFLGIDDPRRTNTSVAPDRLKGDEILALLAGYQHEFGKSEDTKKKNKKSTDEENPWRKLPILFQLSYWKSISCGHYLDVMHIEKNMCDNVLGNLLDMPGKTKDHIKARRDLKEMNIMSELHLKEFVDGKIEMPKSKFWMSIKEKRRFCGVLKRAKLPKDCGSNIARCVQVAERKVIGYKSHDAHLLMQHLLPIAARTTLHKDVALPLIKLSSFFRGVCSKVINPEDLDQLQTDIVNTLCEFERIFPPAFFDIMVHLPVHIVEEIRLGGPVCSRWMYPIERYLRQLKSYVRNKSQPEGSIVEGYIADECVTFCARYLSDSTLASSGVGEDIDDGNETTIVLSRSGSPIMGKGKVKKEYGAHKMDINTWNQAHKYVLFNCGLEEVERYIEKHLIIVSHPRKRKWDSANILDWKYMPTKEYIWSFVKEKFIIPEEGKNYVLEAVNTDWRSHKCKIKRDHYKAYETYDERWAHRPASIPEIQFKELLDYWDSFVGQDIAATNTSNRQKHEDVHTLGPCSIARLRYELEQNNPNKEPPVESMVYKESRKRDPKRSYKTSGVKTKTNIEKMNKIELEIQKGEKSNNVDPFSEVVKQHSGRAFLQGGGVKVSRSKGKEKKGGYIMDQAFFQQMKAEWTEEVTTNLASKIFSQLQAANPHMNLVIPDFTALSQNSDRVTREENLQNDVELLPTPQEECDEDDAN